MGKGESPMKRMRTDDMGKGKGKDMGGGGGWGGGGPKEHLVTQLKQFQRMGEDQKALWAEYADQYLGGVRDPNRHDAATLHEFCMNHGVPGVEAGAMKGGKGGDMFGGKGKMGGMPGIMADMMMWGPKGMGKGFGGDYGGGGGGGGGGHKQALIERVKAFQKLSRDNAEVWHQWCGTLKDPSRHTPEKLEEFLQANGA